MTDGCATEVTRTTEAKKEKILATIQCEIVSAEQSLFSGAITALSLRGTIGELGITPGHAPLLTGISPGAVTLRLEDGTEEIDLFRLGRVSRSAAGLCDLAGRYRAAC